MAKHARQSRTLSVYTSPTLWAGVLERAIKTAAQTALAAGIGTATMLHEVPWQAVASTVALAVLASVLTSLADPDRTDTAVTTGGQDR